MFDDIGAVVFGAMLVGDSSDFGRLQALAQSGPGKTVGAALLDGVSAFAESLKGDDAGKPPQQ